MCLEIDYHKTNEFFNSHENPNQEITVYKDFEYNKKGLGHFYYTSSFRYKSSGTYYETDKCQINNRTIYGGAIHARYYHKWLGSENKLKLYYYYNVPIRVKVRDVIALGKDKDIAFKRFRFEKRTWERIRKKILEYKKRDHWGIW